MLPTDRKRFAMCLMACSELYGKPISDAVTSLWWGSLEAYDIAAVEDAFNRHIKNPDTGQFMPKPADIIRAISGTTVDSSLMAWSKVDKAVRNVGPYRSVVFDDAAIHAVIQDMGGWVRLGEKKEDEWPFIAKEFQTRYRGRKASNDRNYPARLTGIAERENVKEGHAIEAPVLLGDPDKAMLVLTSGSSASSLQVTFADDIKRLSVFVEDKAEH